MFFLLLINIDINWVDWRDERRRDTKGGCDFIAYGWTIFFHACCYFSLNRLESWTKRRRKNNCLCDQENANGINGITKKIITLIKLPKLIICMDTRMVSTMHLAQGFLFFFGFAYSLMYIWLKTQRMNSTIRFFFRRVKWSEIRFN